MDEGVAQLFTLEMNNRSKIIEQLSVNMKLFTVWSTNMVRNALAKKFSSACLL
jgi:hypothetical protein